MLDFYIIFSVFYWAHIFFYQWPESYKDNVPIWVLIGRDVIWLLICLIAFIKLATVLTKNGHKFFHHWKKYYKHILICFAPVYLLYLAVAFSHLGHKNLLDVFQFDVRNIMMYVSVLFLLPLWVRRDADIKRFTGLILKLGILVSVFGISSAVFYKPWLWPDGRIISTLGNPNNLGLFLNLCLFLSVPELILCGSRSNGGGVACSLYFLCLLFTGSFTMIFMSVLGILIIIVLAIKKHKLRYSDLSTLAILAFLAFVVLYTSGYSKVLSERFEARFLGQTLQEISSNPIQTSISGRITQIKDVCNFLGRGSIMSFLFGDYSLQRYLLYDPFYCTMIRNNGIIVCIAIPVAFFLTALVGFKKYVIFYKQKNFDMAAIMLGGAMFILLSLIIAFNGSVFLNRFPINFFFYLILGLMLITTVENKDANEYTFS